MDPELRPAGPEDDAFLFALYASTRAEELDAWGLVGPQREGFLRMQYLAQQQHYRAQLPRADHRIILLGGAPAGRLLVDRRQDELRLADIALLPEHRARGLGTRLVRALLKEARAAGLPVRLHALQGSRAAALYERLGFTARAAGGPYVLMEWRPGG
ncbi:MAG TPA: GNAT family N-acetyltransferase [Myxococcaceae bacterium]|nr:GNAT family N-acetyltransferase [Myxococcaceae bacterium]